MDSAIHIVVVGSHTSSYVMHCKRLPTPGEYLIADRYTRSMDGGKGSNQAIALARLGAHPHLVAVLGDDEERDFLLDYCAHHGVDTTYLTIVPQIATAKGVAFMNPEGIPLGATDLGAIRYMTMEMIEQALPAFSTSRLLLTQLEIPVELALYACKLGKQNGLITILNPAPADELVGKSISDVDILTPNEPEARLLAGFDPQENVPIDVIAKHLREHTSIETIIITLGNQGAIVYDPSGLYHYPCPVVQPIDTSGAGDCFNAALAITIGSGEHIDSAVRFALKAASLSVTKPQVWPAFPTYAEVINFNEAYTT
jgi:ribokinase